jgi:hypothetical protein
VNGYDVGGHLVNADELAAEMTHKRALRQLDEIIAERNRLRAEVARLRGLCEKAGIDTEEGR